MTDTNRRTFVKAAGAAFTATALAGCAGDTNTDSGTI